MKFVFFPAPESLLLHYESSMTGYARVYMPYMKLSPSSHIYIHQRSTKWQTQDPAIPKFKENYLRYYRLCIWKCPRSCRQGVSDPPQEKGGCCHYPSLALLRPEVPSNLWLQPFTCLLSPGAYLWIMLDLDCFCRYFCFLDSSILCSSVLKITGDRRLKVAW